MRSHFTMDSRIIYLNSGTHSVCPDAVLDAIARHQREYELNPTRSLFGIWARLWDAQTRLARFFRADPRDIFLRPNITVALNEMILGMPLPPGSEILATDLEYGAIYNTCRYRAERDGLKLRDLPLPSDAASMRSLTADRLVELFVSAIRPETKMLVLSHVMTGNGLLMPLERIAAETRRRGVLLVVDGAHAAGGVELRFDRLDDVDFYGANLHKWMLGPKGTSFGWVAKRHQEALRPLMAGWCTFETPEYFAAFGGGSRFQGKMMMVGSRDFAPFLAIHEMIDFWEKHGPAEIREAISAKTDRLAALMAEKAGWPRLTSADRGLRGPLVAYDPPASLKALGGQLMESLYQKHGLQVSTPLLHGQVCVRLSPNAYNTDEELVRAAEILGSLQ